MEPMQTEEVESSELFAMLADSVGLGSADAGDAMDEGHEHGQPAPPHHSQQSLPASAAAPISPSSSLSAESTAAAAAEAAGKVNTYGLLTQLL
jgi:hypothetical protein